MICGYLNWTLITIITVTITVTVASSCHHYSPPFICPLPLISPSALRISPIFSFSHSSLSFLPPLLYALLHSLSLTFPYTPPLTCQLQFLPIAPFPSSILSLLPCFPPSSAAHLFRNIETALRTFEIVSSPKL